MSQIDNDFKTIIFVCKGNIERSVVAEIYFSKKIIEKKLQSKYAVSSCGLMGSGSLPAPKFQNLTQYSAEWLAAREILEKYAIDIRHHQAQSVTTEIIELATLVVAMDPWVLNESENSLFNQFSRFQNKMKLFTDFIFGSGNVFDCGGSSDAEKHSLIIELIVSGIDNNFQKFLDEIEYQYIAQRREDNVEY